ncbi:MAG: magnesium transporter [Candidatus Peribacteraceae bacterium]|nr:magnesium transporter [Candidatus Peribacteraceae bacterium]MBP9850568.1 magnesium transporter [Candidatus Peribacteraceae bacterium]
MKEKLLAKADALLGKKQDNELRQLLSGQDFHVIAQVVDSLTHGKRKTFALLPPEKQAEVALALSEDSKRRIFSRLSDAVVARFLHFNDEDDATDILQHLSETRRNSILLSMKEDKRRKIEKLLRFGSETAGGLMDLNFIIVHPSFLWSDVLEKIRKHVEEKRTMPTVLVLSQEGKVEGFLPERVLLFPPQKATVMDQMIPLMVVSHKVDRENVMQLMSKMRSEVICVADDNDQVLGIIHLRDLMKVAQAEATEDIYRFAGVDVDEHALDPVLRKVRRRYNWLLINLLTGFMAAFVVARFQDTISRFAILAAYMPIVAGMGGNTATQALAVVVRGLALGEIGWSKAKRVVFKEACAGTINGVITGVCAALVSGFFGAPRILGLILAAAMIINLFVAGFFGALIPFVLKRLKIDPAIASSVFVTTTTDICGFLAFLGLATIFMH